MIILMACGRWCLAFVVWLGSWCAVGLSEMQHCRLTLDVALTASNQQPAAVLAALDWGVGCRLLDAAVAEQQRTKDSCGPAALVRLARGSRQSMHASAVRPDAADLAHIAGQIDRVLATDGRGCTLGDLSRAARHLGFPGDIRAANDLRALALPSILHLRRGHFVVLEDITADAARFFDPAHGVLLVQPRRLAMQWSGAALQLARGSHLPVAAFPVAGALP
jgi:predicted double-glycine peptidase